MNERGFKRDWFPLLLGAVLLLLAHYAALLFRIHPSISLWFPPSGVAITLAVWFGMPAAIVTGLVSTLVAPIWGSHGWLQWVGLTDAVEPLVAWWFYRKFWQRSPGLGRLKDISAFILSAPVFACASSAIVGSLVLAIVGRMSWAKVASAMPQWWLGNAIGTMVIAPIALLTLTPTLQRWNWLPGEPSTGSPSLKSSRVRNEAIAIAALSIGTAILSVSHTSQYGLAFQQLAFLNLCRFFGQHCDLERWEVQEPLPFVS
ncbi:ATPase, histidine kinase-, DNA gyrase B-, and HSP90-like domain protein [Leptolyngbya sp. NIES-3755]|nr:ATPase, histidine kinase-, DNA gyrase B-, and HSP90-like domain protein [Leptolyngbya sp. NIES-3755]